jgi:hypothetical protein
MRQHDCLGAAVGGASEHPKRTVLVCAHDPRAIVSLARAGWCPTSPVLKVEFDEAREIHTSRRGLRALGSKSARQRKNAVLDPIRDDLAINQTSELLEAHLSFKGGRGSRLEDARVKISSDFSSTT